MSKSTYAVSAILAASLFVNTVEAVPCRALALSGGGSNGAWEAGVMWGLTHYGNPEDYYWDVLSGISAGSFNSVSVAGFAPEDSIEMTEQLSKQWEFMTNHDIFQKWSESTLVETLQEEVSMYDTSPALEYFADVLSRFPEGYKKKVSIGATNIQTGSFDVFDQDNTEFSDLKYAAIASASVPYVWNPTAFRNSYYQDGGIAWNINIDSAIKQCMDVVNDPSEIIVDVLICFDPEISKEEKTGWTALGNLLRARGIHKYTDAVNSIDEEMRAYPDVTYRHLFLNFNATGGLDMLDFSNSTTWDLQHQGRQQAKDMLGLSEGFNGFKTLQDWQANEDNLEAEHKSLYAYWTSFFR